MLLQFPEWNRTCEDCVKYLYNSSGKRVMVRNAANIPLPMLRPRGSPTPCHHCAKIPEDYPRTREHAVELTDVNFQAFRHYRRCRAVNRFPDDPIVEHDAEVIRSVYDSIERSDATSLVKVLATVLAQR